MLCARDTEEKNNVSDLGFKEKEINVWQKSILKISFNLILKIFAFQRDQWGTSLSSSSHFIFGPREERSLLLSSYFT